MVPRNPNYHASVVEIFNKAGFIQNLGISFVDCGPGWCESEVVLNPSHYQHHGLAHAGVQATIADHTAGAAASTLIEAHQYVLSVEFKVNLLRAAKGNRLFCRSQVLKPGRTFSIVESEVFSLAEGPRQLVSKALLTMAILEERQAEAPLGEPPD